MGTIIDGYVYILNRAKDLVKVRGWQVSPVEVEAALLQHPRVKDVAVIKVADGTDEVPLAIVVPSNGYRPYIDELRLKAKQLLAGYKLPKHVVFVDETPRNSTRKILRREPREQMSSVHL